MNLIFAGENSDPDLGKSVPCAAEKNFAFVLGCQLRVLRSLSSAVVSFFGTCWYFFLEAEINLVPELLQKSAVEQKIYR